MLWENLKKNMCPNCSAYLTRAPFSATARHYCGRCTFQIGHDKFEKIVQDLYKPKQKRCDTFERNFADLQNLGHKEISDDFSDSQPDA